MFSTPNQQQNDQHDVPEITPEVVLASREDSKKPPTLASGITSDPANLRVQIGSAPPIDDVVPLVDKAFRAAAVNDIRNGGRRTTIGRSVVRAFVAMLLVAGGSAAAAVTWQVYGNSAKEAIATLTPQLSLTSSSSTEARATAADQATPQPVTAQATDDTEPAPAAASPEQLPSQQSMAHDLATMGQQINQLKASIEQLNASIEQLRNSQEQMSREIGKASETKASETKASEQAAQTKVSVLPPRPTAAPVRNKPKPPAHAQTPAAPPVAPRAQTTMVPPAAPRAQTATLPPLQQAPLPQAPLPQATPAASAPLPVEASQQPEAPSDGGPVLRPPMPVR